jgi:hypothetical protein
MINHKAKLGLLAATTLVVAACSSNNDRKPSPDSGNQAPVVAAIADQSVDQDTAVGPIQITVSDKETDAGSLTVVAAADNSTVFPKDGVVLSGSGATRTLTLTPFEAATGVTTIALLVTDASNASATRTFKVTVNAKAASVKAVARSTFAKGESDDATVVNGFTFAQDADDPATFEALIPVESP